MGQFVSAMNDGKVLPTYIQDADGQRLRVKCPCGSASYGRGWPTTSPHECAEAAAAVMCEDCGDHGFGYWVGQGAKPSSANGESA